MRAIHPKCACRPARTAEGVGAIGASPENHEPVDDNVLHRLTIDFPADTDDGVIVIDTRKHRTEGVDRKPVLILNTFANSRFRAKETAVQLHTIAYLEDVTTGGSVAQGSWSRSPRNV